MEVHDQLGRDKEQHEGGDNHNYNPKDNLNYFNGVIPCMANDTFRIKVVQEIL